MSYRIFDYLVKNSAILSSPSAAVALMTAVKGLVSRLPTKGIFTAMPA